MRYPIVLVMILSLIGCSRNQLNYNPFARPGPSVMPPPSTGSAGRPDPYYRPSAPGANTGAPGDYGVGWNGRPSARPQMARFTSEDAPQMKLADQRVSYATPSSAAATDTKGVNPVER